MVNVPENKTDCYDQYGALFTRKEAADYLRIKPQTLAKWDCTKFRNIRCCKIGNRVMYRKAWLDEYITVNTEVRSVNLTTNHVNL